MQLQGFLGGPFTRIAKEFSTMTIDMYSYTNLASVLFVVKHANRIRRQCQSKDSLTQRGLYLISPDVPSRIPSCSITPLKYP